MGITFILLISIERIGRDNHSLEHISLLTRHGNHSVERLIVNNCIKRLAQHEIKLK